MKAKLKTAYFLKSEKAIIAGTECEIIDSWCGTDGFYYLCDFGNGDIYPIKNLQLEITDRRPIVNWEQRRYEIAKDVLAAFMSNSNSNVFAYSKEMQAEDAVEYADALIEELKKK